MLRIVKPFEDRDVQFRNKKIVCAVDRLCVLTNNKNDSYWIGFRGEIRDWRWTIEEFKEVLLIALKFYNNEYSITNLWNNPFEFDNRLYYAYGSEPKKGEWRAVRSAGPSKHEYFFVKGFSMHYKLTRTDMWRIKNSFKDERIYRYLRDELAKMYEG